MSLDPTTLKSLSSSDRPQSDYADGANGLIFRVSRENRRVWLVRYRTLEGRRRGVPLGGYPAIGLSEARIRARDICAAASRGEDPAAIRQTRRIEAQLARERGDPKSLDELFERYKAAAVAGRHKARGRPKRMSSIALEISRWTNHIKPTLGSKPIKEVTRREVRIWLDHLASSGLSAAAVNGCGAVLRLVLSYAMHRELIDANPAFGVATPFEIASRDRVLSKKDLAAVWTALTAEPSIAMEPGTALCLAFAAATLQRLNDACGLQLSEIDDDAGLWTIPADRIKGGRVHVVPLSPLALKLITRARRLIPKGSKYLFPGRGRYGALERHGVTRAYARLTSKLEIADATPHDNRRTGATTLTSEGLGHPRFVVSRILDHKSDTGGAAWVTSVYDRNDYLKEKRRALEDWATFLEGLSAPPIKGPKA